MRIGGGVLLLLLPIDEVEDGDDRDAIDMLLKNISCRLAGNGRTYLIMLGVVPDE